MSSRKAVPESASCNVARMRIRVDLPAIGTQQSEHSGADVERYVLKRLNPVAVALVQLIDTQLHGSLVYSGIPFR